MQENKRGINMYLLLLKVIMLWLCWSGPLNPNEFDTLELRELPQSQYQISWCNDYNIMIIITFSMQHLLGHHWCHITSHLAVFVDPCCLSRSHSYFVRMKRKTAETDMITANITILHSTNVLLYLFLKKGIRCVLFIY